MCFAAATQPEEHPLQVDREDAIPLGFVEFQRRFVRHDAGIVDEDVEATQFGNHAIHCGRDVGNVADVEREEGGAPAGGSDGADRLGRFDFHCRQVENRDVGTGGGEPGCDRAPDPACSSGDGGHFPIDAKRVHEKPFNGPKAGPPGL
jgi:hypothetical protein